MTTSERPSTRFDRAIQDLAGRGGDPHLPVVVAVGTAPETVAALRWAVGWREANLGSLRVVAAYSPAPQVVDAAGAYWSADGDLARDERGRVATLIRRAAPGCRVDPVIRSGSIEGVLVEESRHAAALVLGTSVGRGWRDRLRPPLANRLIGIAHCPVVCVPTANIAD